jgi:hypothetical protein
MEVTQTVTSVDPAKTEVRVDVQVFLAKLGIVSVNHWLMSMAPVIVMFLTGWMVHFWTKSAADAHITSVGSFILMLGMLFGVYRLVYDLIFLALPILFLVLGKHASWQKIPLWTQRLLLCLLCIPALNFLWTGPGKKLGYALKNSLMVNSEPLADLVWYAVTTINPIALCLTWVILLAMTLRIRYVAITASVD